MPALPVHDIVEVLHDAGLRVSLVSGGDLGVSPASRLTHELRDLIRGNKAVLVDWLQAANDQAPEPPLDPEAWHELAQAYYAHHFNCNVCIAAGRGSRYGPRCGAGTGLWNAYQRTSP
ncbi:MAG: hypothetical protein JWR74_328 [Polaromonas sp.]|nr:hypothetical protein [Polaromonas sp.]